MASSRRIVEVEDTMTYREVIPIFWSFLWRTILGTILLGFSLGFLAGVAAAWMGRPGDAENWGAIAGFLATYPAAFWAFRAALNGHRLFRDVTPP